MVDGVGRLCVGYSGVQQAWLFVHWHVSYWGEGELLMLIFLVCVDDAVFVQQAQLVTDVCVVRCMYSGTR